MNLRVGWLFSAQLVALSSSASVFVKSLESHQTDKMNALLAVEREVDKIISNFSGLNDHVQKTLNDLIVQLQSLQQDFVQLNQGTSEISTIQRMIMDQNIKKIKDILHHISNEHKDQHAAVSKIGKQIDKNFYSEFQCISNDQHFFVNLNDTLPQMEESVNEESGRKGSKSSKQLELINKVILQHFHRLGCTDVADELIREARLRLTEEEEEEIAPFEELNYIVDALRNNDLEPALQWAIKHQDKLNERKSLLFFKLHSLKFIEMLKKTDEAMNRMRAVSKSMSVERMVGEGEEENDDDEVEEEEEEEEEEDGEDEDGDMVMEDCDKTSLQMQQDLINYARTNLQQFSHRHSKEIQQLMCCLMYLPNGLLKSPYQHLFAENISEIVDLFIREAASLYSLSVESPLIVTIKAGCTALPSLINIRHLMRQKQVAGVWSCKEELPMRFELPEEIQFHSVFACPILREQSKESNPPMRLICGHVISNEALSKLTNGTKMKCPYCPVEQNPLEARQVYF